MLAGNLADNFKYFFNEIEVFLQQNFKAILLWSKTYS